jgi:hypothetical protein
MHTAVSSRKCWLLVFLPFACYSGVSINFAAGCQSTTLVSEALEPLLALLGSSAWASQEVNGEGGKFAFVDCR